MRDFFTFREMVSTGIVQILYFVGMVILTVGGVAAAIMYRESDPPLAQFGILAVLVGNLIWRLFCEGMIVIYRIHDALVSIDRKLPGTRERVNL